MIDPTDNKTADLVIAAEAQRQMQQIQTVYGDNLPYSYDRVLNECAFFMEQSAIAALELGKRLILLKEMEGHGNFGRAVQQLGISDRTARQVMQAALKFSNRHTSADLPQQIKSRSKLFELMILDDGELQELSDGGTVANIKLDDVDRMSVRELRAALRESKEAARAKDQVLAGKNSKLDEMEGKLNTLSRKLTEKQGLLAQITPEQEATRLRNEVAAVAVRCEIDLLTRELPIALRQLVAHTERTGISHEAMMRAWVVNIQRALDVIRDEFSLYGDIDETEADWWQNPDTLAKAEQAVGDPNFNWDVIEGGSHEQATH